MQRFHISKRGAPAVCKAKKGKCPLGGENKHYDSWTEAQNAADKLNKEDHGLTNELKEEKKVNPILNLKGEDLKKELEERIALLSEKDEQTEDNTYFSRCKSSVIEKNYEPPKKKSKHLTKDRAERTKIIEEVSGKGEILQYLRVNHTVDGVEEEQVIGVYSNGLIEIYGEDPKHLITSFTAGRGRIETMFVKAGIVVNDEWLDEVESNHSKINSLWRAKKKQMRRERENKKRDKVESAFEGFKEKKSGDLPQLETESTTTEEKGKKLKLPEISTLKQEESSSNNENAIEERVPPKEESIKTNNKELSDGNIKEEVENLNAESNRKEEKSNFISKIRNIFMGMRK